MERTTADLAHEPRPPARWVVTGTTLFSANANACAVTYIPPRTRRERAADALRKLADWVER